MFFIGGIEFTDTAKPQRKPIVGDLPSAVRKFGCSQYGARTGDHRGK